MNVLHDEHVDDLIDTLYAWGEEISKALATVLNDIDNPDNFGSFRNLPVDVQNALKQAAGVLRVSSLIVTYLTRSEGDDMETIAQAGTAVNTFAGFIHFCLSQTQDSYKK